MGADGTKLHKFAQGELRVVEAKLDELRMDLLKVFRTFAFGEEGKRWMDVEKFVGWIG